MTTTTLDLDQVPFADKRLRALELAVKVHIERSEQLVIDDVIATAQKFISIAFDA